MSDIKISKMRHSEPYPQLLLIIGVLAALLLSSAGAGLAWNFEHSVIKLAQFNDPFGAVEQRNSDQGNTQTPEQQSSQQRVEPPPTDWNKLSVHLTAVSPTLVKSINEMRLDGLISNHSDTPAVINTFVLAAPVLALQVKTLGGKELPTNPPPTPPADLERYNEQLEPGQSRVYHLSLAGMFGYRCPPGKYLVRMKEGQSNEVVVSVYKTAR